jgi:hypothetical protein
MANVPLFKDGVPVFKDGVPVFVVSGAAGSCSCCNSCPCDCGGCTGISQPTPGTIEVTFTGTTGCGCTVLGTTDSQKTTGTLDGTYCLAGDGCFFSTIVVGGLSSLHYTGSTVCGGAADDTCATLLITAQFDGTNWTVTATFDCLDDTFGHIGNSNTLFSGVGAGDCISNSAAASNTTGGCSSTVQANGGTAIVKAGTACSPGTPTAGTQCGCCHGATSDNYEVTFYGPESVPTNPTLCSWLGGVLFNSTTPDSVKWLSGQLSGATVSLARVGSSCIWAGTTSAIQWTYYAGSTNCTGSSTTVGTTIYLTKTNCGIELQARPTVTSLGASSVGAHYHYADMSGSGCGCGICDLNAPTGFGPVLALLTPV